MADSQIHLNEDDPIPWPLYIRCVLREYPQPTPSTCPSGSAPNPVVIQDDDPPGSVLNPVVIPDDEPLDPPAEPHTPVTGSEHLADVLQDQSPPLEIEDTSSDSGSSSISSRPSSDSAPTSGVSSTSPPDSSDPSSTTEASSTSDLSPESRASSMSDASPPTSPRYNIPYLAFRWHFSLERESPPRREDSCQPSPARVWNDTICSKCGQRGHVASAHCRHCSLIGHRASDHCRTCDQIGHNHRDHCILCNQVGFCVVGYCARAHCKRCNVTGHDDTHHCTRCLLLGHGHWNHCDVCDVVNCRTENHCYVCAQLGHSSQDHCENCEELGHKDRDHCWSCREVGHNWESCSKRTGQDQGDFCWICRSHGHGKDACPSLKQYKLRAKWAFGRLQRSRSAQHQRWCQCCLEIRESRYSFHQEHKLKDCPKLFHKTACLEKDHRSPKCQEWILRFSRNAATQVNLAEFSTDVDVGEKTIVPDNFISPSVFTAISSSTQTVFPEVHVGRKSYRSVASDRLTLSESSPVGKKVKTTKGCEEATQHRQRKCGDDSCSSTFNEASDHPAPGHLLETFDDNQPKESTDSEQMRLEAKARLQQEIEMKVQQTMLEDDEEPDVDAASLHSQDSYESHLSTSPVTPASPFNSDFEKNVFKNLNDSLLLLGRNTEELLSERADMPVSSTAPQTSASMEVEQPEIQQDISSTNSQESPEIGQDNLLEYFDVPAVRYSSPAPSDRECSPFFTRVTLTTTDTPMVSQNVPPPLVPAEDVTYSTGRCPNSPSSSDFKGRPCRDGRSLIDHKLKQSLLGRASVRKRKHKPRKALANKKQKPDSNSGSTNSAMADATLQDHTSIGTSPAVSLPGGHPISWQELCYTVMLDAPNHSSNFKQLCNLVRNWLYNTFPSIEFNINDKDLLANLKTVLKNSPNFEVHEQPEKRKKKKTLIKVSIRENATKKVKIVVSCFRAKLARPVYLHNMSTYLVPESRLRPETSLENLIGMAFHALPNKHVEEAEIVMWIKQNIPGYQTNHKPIVSLYKDGDSWVQRLREELRESSFFKMRVREKGDEMWKFRKGCAEYFRKWDGSLQ